MRYAIFISSVPIDDENGFPENEGINAVGRSSEEVAEEARELIGELWAQDGPPDPWIVSDDVLEVIEIVLPRLRP